MGKKLIGSGVIGGGTIAIVDSSAPNDSDVLFRPDFYYDKLRFHSSFDYMAIAVQVEAAVSFPYQEVTQSAGGKKGKNPSEIPREGTTLHTIAHHNLGYRPSLIGVRADNNRAIAGSMFFATTDNTSFRLGWFAVDNISIYLKERWFVQYNPLPAENIIFRVYCFNKATV